MSGLTRYGAIWGAIPNTAGRVIWVAPGAGAYRVDGKSYDASDGNDGLDPRRAKATVNSAMDQTTAASGDVIVCLPGTHDHTASIVMDIAGVTLMGLPGGAGNPYLHKTTLDATNITTNQLINVTAADCEIAYLNIIPLTADSGIDLTATADQLYIHHCSFDMSGPAVNAATIGIDAIGGASNVVIDTCVFHVDGAQGAAIVLGAMVDGLVQNCIFKNSAGTWVSAMTQAATGRRMVIRGNEFVAGVGTITNGCLGTTGGEEEMANFIGNHNTVSVTKMVDGYDGGDAVLAVNYIGTVGGGTGGTLVTVTT